MKCTWLAVLLLIISPLAAAPAPVLQPDRVETYKTVGDLALHLNIFLPEAWQAGDRRAAIVLFHGGGWKGGEPSALYPFCDHFASEGMVAISVEYRLELKNKATPFDGVHDAKAAVRWVRAHAAELGIDPGRIAAGGGSAGGHLAAATATVPGLDDAPDSPVSPVPDALVLFNPVYDNGPEGYGYERIGERYQEISPIDNIREGMPPAIVFLGTKDNLVPVATAKRFQSRMQAVGSRSELKLFDGQPHGFFNYQKNQPDGGPIYQQVLADADAFLTSLGYLDTPQATGSAKARFGLEYEPVDFTPPPVDRTRLPNGMILYHYAEPEVPLVTILVHVGVGSVRDPAGKVGAAAMTAQVIRNGGSRALPGDELDRALEGRGAALSVETDREETWFRLNLLKEDVEWGMKILGDLLNDPLLPQEKLDEARGRALVDLKQRLDVPRDFAGALYPQLVYGQGNPWGWTETERTLTALTVDDLRAIYEQYYRADNCLVGLSGAIDTEMAQRLAGAVFGGAEMLKGDGAALPPLPDAQPIGEAITYLVPRPITQDVIYLGHEGIGRFDPDKFAFKIYNLVLSGGFSSRLFKQVRSDRGLAYAVYGRMGEGTRQGIYYNVALTKAESVDETLSLMIQINHDLQQTAPTTEEVMLARQAAVNSFVFLFETAEQMMRQKMTLDYFQYPADYLDQYVARLKAVTPEEIRQAAADRIHIDRAITLIIGAVDDALRQKLEARGTVIEIDDEALRAQWL